MKKPGDSMGTKYEKLTAKFVRDTDAPGRYPDGGNLYLQVTKTGAKSWVFRYQIAGREKMAGLGPVNMVGLQEARAEARRLWTELKAGVDPVAARKELRAGREAEAARLITFAAFAGTYIDSHKASWKNEKHAGQWARTLETYAFPYMGRLPIQEVETAHVLKALEAIWQDKTETAERVRQRIMAVLDAAESMGLRSGANPARWKHHLERLLPDPGKITKVKPQPSLPYARVASFVTSLRRMPGFAPHALHFLILTAARSGEVRGMRWREVDLDAAVWVIPADRMKMKREHTVPLSPAAVDILRSLPPGKPDAFVFPGQKKGTCFSDAALSVVIKRMNRDADPAARWIDPKENNREIVPHGFRATFRSWVADQTNFPRELAEHALAHNLPGPTELAYDRGDKMTKRRQMMSMWADHCAAPAGAAPGKVVNLARSKGAA
jgi:integrase